MARAGNDDDIDIWMRHRLDESGVVHGDEVALHMEKMKLRSIPSSIVVPAAPLTFRGEELLGPADPTAFLAERYGEDWNISDPYHDWLWALEPGTTS